MEKNEQNVNSKENQMPNLLVGYVRRSQAGKAVNVSINTNAFGDCRTYCTDDGQCYAAWSLAWTPFARSSKAKESLQP